MEKNKFINFNFILVLLNIFYHFIPFERKSLSPDDYSLLVYERVNTNYFFNFFERPIQFYYLDLQYLITNDNAFLGLIILFLSSSILIIVVNYFLNTLLKDNNISFLISLLYLVFYTKTGIYNNLINAHIILVSILYLLSFTFFIKYTKNKKNIYFFTSIFLYLISIFWYEIGIFLPLIFLLFKKSSLKIIFSYFFVTIIYLTYRIIGLLFFNETNDNHSSFSLDQIINAFYSFINLYAGRSAFRTFIYGIYQYFKIPFYLLIIFIICNSIIIYFLYNFLNKLDSYKKSKILDKRLYLILLISFLIFSIPNILHGSLGDRHTIIINISVISIAFLYLIKFKNFFKISYLLTFLILSIVSQGNSWSHTVSTRINSSVYDFINNNKQEISKSNFIIFDKLSFKKNIHHELIYNKNNLLNTYFGAQVFEDWGINGMIVKSLNNGEKNKILILKDEYNMENNNMNFIYNEKKYSIPLNEIFIINYDSVYKNGFLNGITKK